jgi:hypothetical protein
VIGERKTLLQRFGGVGASLASGALAEVEDRSLWARYGL